MRDKGDDPCETHNFAEEREPSGRLILGPCLNCGLAAMDAMEDLRRALHEAGRPKSRDEVATYLREVASCDATLPDPSDAMIDGVWELVRHPATTLLLLAVQAWERGEAVVRLRSRPLVRPLTSKRIADFLRRNKSDAAPSPGATPTPAPSAARPASEDKVTKADEAREANIAYEQLRDRGLRSDGSTPPRPAVLGPFNRGSFVEGWLARALRSAAATTPTPTLDKCGWCGLELSRVAEGWWKCALCAVNKDHRGPCEKCDHTQTTMFVCPTCGPRVKADEDGCCAACGAECSVKPLTTTPGGDGGEGKRKGGA